MAAWSQVFDDRVALATSRRHARHLLIGFALVSGLLVSAAPLATIWGGASAGVIVLICGVLLSASAGVVLFRLGRLHRRWCRYEVSTLGIAATDTAGRRTALLWRTVQTVDVADDVLTVTGRDVDGRALDITAERSVPRFDTMVRYVVRCAHAHRCNLSVDGDSVDSLPLDALTATTARPQRGGPAEPAGSGD